MQACSYIFVLCSCFQSYSCDCGLDVDSLECGLVAKKIKIPQQTSKAQGPDEVFALFLVVIHINVIPCMWGQSKRRSLSPVFLIEITPNSHTYTLAVSWRLSLRQEVKQLRTVSPCFRLALARQEL